MPNWNFASTMIATAGCLVALPFSPCVASAADAPKDAAACIDGYEQWLKSITAISFGFRATAEETGGSVKETTRMYTAEGSLQRSANGGWHFRSRERGRRWFQGFWVPFDQESESLSAKDDYIVNVDFDKDDKTAELPPEAPLPEREAKSVSLRVGLEKPQSFAEYYRRELNPVFGRFGFDDGTPLPTILREGSPQLRTDSAAGDEAGWVAVESSGLKGKHTVWLDPAKGFVPMRIRVEKGPQDLSGKLALSKLVASIQKGDRQPNTPVRNFVYEMRTQSVVPASEANMIGSFTATEEYTYQDGNVYKEVDDVQLDNIKLNPEASELVLTIPIPDGSPVTLTNARGIECEWRGGEIHRVFDDATVRSLSDLEFRPGISRTRLFVIVANAFLFIVIAAYLLMRQRSARAA